MKIQQSIAVFIMVTLTIVTGQQISTDKDSNISSFNYMARSGSSELSMLCFNHYMSLIKNITETYQYAHNECLTVSNDGRSEAEAATWAERLALAASANNSCELFDHCSQISSCEQVFECYSSSSSDNSKTMHEIKMNSTESLSNLREVFHSIKIEEHKCTNETKRTYEKNFATEYDNLQKCNMGMIDPPTPIPTQEPVTAQTTKMTDTSIETESSTTAAVSSTEETDTSESTVAPKALRRLKAFKIKQIKH